MNYRLKKLVYPFYSILNNLPLVQKYKIRTYTNKGRVPWSFGYAEYKTREISRVIEDFSILKRFQAADLPENYGYRLDERIVEYGWIFSRLNGLGQKMLDAGSTFNFEHILNSKEVRARDITIFTFHPEVPSFRSLENVKYVYGDLREMPFPSDSFDLVVSQSTIEHIDMDNSIYGYDLAKNEDVLSKSYDYLLAVKEFNRVLSPNGTLLLTFPYGIFKNYGFFQQFDREMVDRLEELLAKTGVVKKTFAKYYEEGWTFSSQDKCDRCLSHNPSTGEDVGSDGAAHSRSICLIEYSKN